MRIALVAAECEENLAIRYIWSALTSAGHEVTPVSFNEPEEAEEAARKLATSGAELAGFSMVFTYRARQFAELAARAKGLGFRGHIVAGGHFAAFNADRLLMDVPAFDSVALGEGEEIMVQLAASLAHLPAVNGLVWRDAEGRIHRNAAAAKPAELDRRAFPERRLPLDHYLGLPIANMLASRGCTHACAFCSISAWHRFCGGERHRVRDVECVAEEMADLYHRRGVRIFNFHDDNFLLPDRSARLDRLHGLRGAWERRGLGRIAFAIKARPDEVDEESFFLLKEMGLFRVFLGIEAGTAESLRRLGRGQSLDENQRALALVNDLDIHTCFNLLIFNPDSTLEDVRANIAFLREHPRNPMNFCRTEVYAGTPLESRLRREGRLMGDYWGYDYRITDPRVQRLFEAAFSAFRERNYGARALHHLTMAVDYEHQLLAHFFETDPALRRRVKEFIVTVNRNTCEALDGLASSVAKSEDGLAVRAIAERLRADNERLSAQADEILRRIRLAACRRRNPEEWRRIAAAAGIAVTLTLGATGCERTHPSEMVPPGPKQQALSRLTSMVLQVYLDAVGRGEGVSVILL